MTPSIDIIKLREILKEATNHADWGRTRVEAAEELRNLSPTIAAAYIDLFEKSDKWLCDTHILGARAEAAEQRVHDLTAEIERLKTKCGL